LLGQAGWRVSYVEACCQALVFASGPAADS
jgi:hypothetical protein